MPSARQADKDWQGMASHLASHSPLDSYAQLNETWPEFGVARTVVLLGGALGSQHEKVAAISNVGPLLQTRTHEVLRVVIIPSDEFASFATLLPKPYSIASFGSTHDRSAETKD